VFLSTLPTVSLSEDFVDDLCALESLLDNVTYSLEVGAVETAKEEVKDTLGYFKYNLLPQLLALVETNSYLNTLNQLRPQPAGPVELTREQYEQARNVLNELLNNQTADAK
jgi:ribosomal protein L9